MRHFSTRRVVWKMGPVTLAALAALVGYAGMGAPAQAAKARPKESKACGSVPVVGAKDPTHALSILPKKVRSDYNGFSGTVVRSPYRNYKSPSKPWKIGWVSGSLANGWVMSSLSRYESDLKLGAKKGLVSSKVFTAYQPSVAQQSPAAELQDYESLVSKGVNAIIITPLSGPALEQAVTAAGKKGVVTIAISGPIPSPYSVNVGESPFLNATMPLSHILKEIHGKGSILIVRGIPGFPQDDEQYAAAEKMLARCPGVTVAGVLNGGYENSVAKSQVVQWLSAHPGTKIAAVIQDNVMTPGIISAFESLGLKVPPISDTGSQAASLAWEAENLSKGYRTYGTLAGGADQTDAAFRTALRVLAGYKPLVNDIPTVPVLVTPQNVKRLVPKGATPTSSADGDGPLGVYAPNSFLNSFFSKKGQPGGLK